MVFNHSALEFTLQLVLAVTFASSLHFGIEKPFLSLKDREKPIKKSKATESLQAFRTNGACPKQLPEFDEKATHGNRMPLRDPAGVASEASYLN